MACTLRFILGNSAHPRQLARQSPSIAIYAEDRPFQTWFAPNCSAAMVADAAEQTSPTSRECLRWVKMRKTRSEYNESGSHLIADMRADIDSGFGPFRAMRP